MNERMNEQEQIDRDLNQKHSVKAYAISGAITAIFAVFVWLVGGIWEEGFSHPNYEYFRTISVIMSLWLALISASCLGAIIPDLRDRFAFRRVIPSCIWFTATIMVAFISLSLWESRLVTAELPFGQGLASIGALLCALVVFGLAVHSLFHRPLEIKIVGVPENTVTNGIKFSVIAFVFGLFAVLFTAVFIIGGDESVLLFYSYPHNTNWIGLFMASVFALGIVTAVLAMYRMERWRILAKIAVLLWLLPFITMTAIVLFFPLRLM